MKKISKKIEAELLKLSNQIDGLFYPKKIAGLSQEEKKRIEKVIGLCTNRLKNNRKLVRLLKKLVENNPDLRFGQILANWGFVDETVPEMSSMVNRYWKDEFMTESITIRKRVEGKI
jgi:hypothetical protein